MIRHNDTVYAHTVTFIYALSHILTNLTQAICTSDCAILLSSMAETHFPLSNPMAVPIV